MTERAIAIRMAFEIKEKVRRYTPTAVRPPKVSAGVFRTERDDRKPGTLKDSWEIGKPYKVGNLMVIEIYTEDPIAPHVEYDTRPHPIKAKPGSVLRFRSSKTGEVVYATEVMHPGTTGVHMLARACAEVAATPTGSCAGSSPRSGTRKIPMRREDAWRSLKRLAGAGLPGPVGDPPGAGPVRRGGAPADHRGADRRDGAHRRPADGPVAPACGARRRS